MTGSDPNEKMENNDPRPVLEDPWVPATEYDGQIRIGPVPGTNGRQVLEAMQRYGLEVSRGEGADFRMSVSGEGFLIEASGPGVRGYLTDKEGSEASSSDLEDLAACFLREGATLRISGRHAVAEDRLVTHEARLVRRDGQIKVSIRTLLYCPDGQPVVLEEEGPKP